MLRTAFGSRSLSTCRWTVVAISFTLATAMVGCGNDTASDGGAGTGAMNGGGGDSGAGAGGAGTAGSDGMAGQSGMGGGTAGVGGAGANGGTSGTGGAGTGGNTGGTGAVGGSGNGGTGAGGNTGTGGTGAGGGTSGAGGGTSGTGGAGAGTGTGGTGAGGASGGGGAGAGGGTSGTGGSGGPIRALLFTKTETFRHDSIDDAVAWLGALDASEQIDVTHTEDASVFTDEGLRSFEVAVFVSTTGNILNANQQTALERFIQAGKGFVGVHAAADAEYEWPWYEDLIGALFTTHQAAGPPNYGGPFEFTVEDRDHPSTAHLGSTFMHGDEIYSYGRNPRWHANILLTVDAEAVGALPHIFGQPPMIVSTGGDHPVAWYKEFDGGRSWYTNLGHEPATWSLPWFREHVLEGIRWAARSPNQYSKVTVTDNTANPLAMAATPSGDLYYIERTGEVKLWKKATGKVVDAGKVEVSLVGENGLLGIALDPNFGSNGRIYLYYAQAETRDNVLARFDTDSGGILIPIPEVIQFRVPSDREVNHEGGALEFAPDGTLFISTGDNTIPFQSGGYAPLDERVGRLTFNAQRTASNPNDLRGKVLRIRPDGTVPPGNLFDPSGSNGRPEIYVMGTRNPFRIAVNPQTGRLFWGDVGPDAREDGAEGPRGYDEINLADAPGDYGWPLCIANNQAYSDVDFATGAIGAPFSCAGRVPAAIYYDYTSLFHKEFGVDRPGAQGRTAIAGAYYPTQSAADVEALPAPFQDSLLISEWVRNVLVSAKFSAGGQLESLKALLPWERFIRPIDMEVGPDGELFVLEFGSAFFGNNADARVSRIQYSETGALRPTAMITPSRLSGPTPLSVNFSANGSRAFGRDVNIVRYEWDVDGNGSVDGTGSTFQFAYQSPGVYDATLTVIDSAGRRSLPIVKQINAGNTPPVLEIQNSDGATFVNGTTVRSGQSLQLQAVATDAEDDNIPCSAITWDLRLGHDLHTHPEQTSTGCNFSFNTTLPDHGVLNDRLFWAVEVRYTDQGGDGGEAPLTGRTGVRINVN